MIRKVVLCILSVIALGVSAQTFEEMYGEFKRVPDSTRTKVWWFHGENKTTAEGITADLEAYRRAGVGGVVYYDQQHGPGTPDAMPAMSREWWEMLKYAALEAKRLGLSFEVNISNGYVCGGPWITPELGMQAVFSRDTLVRGGRHYRGKLPVPHRKGAHDIAVLAFPAKAGYREDVRCLPGGFTTNDSTTVLLASFDRPFTARSFSYRSNGYSKGAQSIMNVPCDPQEDFCGDNFTLLPPLGELEVSDDGKVWRKVTVLRPCYRMQSLCPNFTISFPATTGRYFRLNLHGWWKKDRQTKAMIGDRAATSELQLSNVVLSARALTDRWEERAAYCSEYIRPALTPDYSGDEVIDRAQLLNLTSKLDENGILDWTAPEGTDWKVVRFFYAPTMGKTKHGRKNLLGLECDKLSVRAAEHHWNNYAQVIIDSLSAIGCHPSGICMDSHEAGSQNWTHDFPALFQEKHGYDVIPWLPAMQGYIVESVDATEKFLRDMRRTIADGANDRYFTTLQRKATEAGVHFTAQAMGNGQSFCSDNLAAKGIVDRPQGEFWTRMHDGAYDIKEAASAAHLYGHQIASAEAFTDFCYRHTFGSVKDEIDMATVFQVNDLVVCASESQPWLSPAKINTGYNRDYALNRQNTMWPFSNGFWDYQARNNYMMRQGKPVVDILVYVGDETPMKLLAHRLPVIPEGYDFDVCSTDGLKQKNVADYKLLAIEKTAVVRPETEELIARLKANGMLVFDNRVQADDEMEGMLSEGGVRPDLQIKSRRTALDRVFFTHRQTGNADIYFLVNHSRDHEFVDSVIMRTGYDVAEWWNAIDGSRKKLVTRRTPQGVKTMLRLKPGEAGFIVASRNVTPGLDTYSTASNEYVTPVKGSWKLTFDTLLGGPKNPVLFCDELVDLAQSDDPDIRYFSGLVTYENSFDVPEKRKGSELSLRIPGLQGVAQVSVNDSVAGIIWCDPWEIDITPFVKSGKNTLRIDVRTPLANRLIGDASLPESQRKLYTYTQLYTADNRPVPSGIIGEVLLCTSGSGSPEAVGQKESPAWDDTRRRNWDDRFKEVSILSSSDGTPQNAYIYKSTQPGAPLIVSLHTWSGDYRQNDPISLEVAQKDWNYIHPDFRGPNKRNEALVSPIAIQDIEDAIVWAVKEMNANPDEVHVVGVSGGGLATLAAFMQVQYPVKSFSAWAPISDIEAWYWESRGRGQNYANHIMQAIGRDGVIDAGQAIRRSPLHQAYPGKLRKDVPLYIYEGCHDGYKGSVPVSHSLLMYNRIAAERKYGISDRNKIFRKAEKDNRLLSQDEVMDMVIKRLKPDADPSQTILGRQVYLHREMENVSITVFEGGHEQLPGALELIPVNNKL